MNIDEKTKQEVLSLIRHNITLYSDFHSRQQLWNLHWRVAGGPKGVKFQIVVFRWLLKNAGFVFMLVIGFICALVLPVLQDNLMNR